MSSSYDNTGAEVGKFVVVIRDHNPMKYWLGRVTIVDEEGTIVIEMNDGTHVEVRPEEDTYQFKLLQGRGRGTQ